MLTKRINKPTLWLSIFLLMAIIWSCQSPSGNSGLISEKQDVSSYFNPEQPYKYEHPVLLNGDSIGKLGEEYYAKAVGTYKMAARELKKNKDWEGYTWALVRISNYFLQANILEPRWQEAKPYIDTLISEMPKYLSLKDNHPFIATAYYCKGTYHYKAFEVDAAEAAFQKALKIRQEYFKKPSIYTANVYFGLAELALELEADLPKSMSLHEKGLAMLKESEEAYPALRGYWIVDGYKTLMDRYQLTENYDKSMSFGYKMLDSLQLLRPRTASFYELSAYNSISENLSNQGQYKQSKSLLEKGAREFQRGQFFSRENYHYLKNRLIWSNLNMELGVFEKALNQLEKITHTITTIKNPEHNILKLQGDSHFAMGTIYSQMENYALAEANFSKALKIYDSLKAPMLVERANVLLAQGDIYKENNQNQAALEKYGAAIRLIVDENQLDQFGLPGINDWWDHAYLMNILQKKGDILLEQFKLNPTNVRKLEEAYHHYRRSVELLVSAFFYLDRETDQLAFTANSYPIFEQTLNCLYLLDSLTGNNKYAIHALEINELSKAKSLLRQILEGDENEKLGAGKNLIYEISSIRKELAFLQLEIRSLKQKDPVLYQEVIAKFYSKTLQLEHQKDRIQKQLLEDYAPDLSSVYASFWQEKGIKATLKQLENDFFLSYFWGDSHCYAIGGSEEDPRFYRHRITQKDLADLTTFSALLKNGYRLESAQQDFERYGKLAYQLFEIYVKPSGIISPAKGTVNNASSLLVIRDGPLSYTPFEALISSIPEHGPHLGYKDLDYLINTTSISYGHSFSVLKLSMSKAKKVLKSPKVLAFSFDPNSEAPNNLLATRSGQAHLPGTTKEVQEISKFFDTHVAPSDMSSKDYFITQAPHFDILLLGLHGALDSVYESKLIFPVKGSSNTKVLYPYEVLGLPLMARLVILGACESGLGANMTGEGLNSMARVFMERGCPSVLMSLWEVPDMATARVMVPFYDNLSQGNSIVDGLRKAKLQFIEQVDQQQAHPGNWAGMVLIGNTQALVGTNTWIFTIGAAILGIIILLFFWFRIAKR